MKRLTIDGLVFDVREGTSDEKAVREVVERRSYLRRDFGPRDGETWIDVGANVGAFSVLAAASGARVRAYEPDPASADLARHNLTLNGLSRYAEVTTAALVADDSPGTATLHCNTARGNVWRNSLVKPWRGGEDIEVPTLPAAEVWSVDHHVKLDAEGSEMPILEALAESRLAGLVFEWSFDIDPSLVRFRAVVERLRKGYGRVVAGRLLEDHDAWRPEWFPPARMVWCWV